MKWSFFLKSKDEQAQVSTTFVKEMKNKYQIERWKFDNAGENLTTQKAFEEQGFGIKVEYTARETPQQNGMVEWAFATLYGRVQTLFAHAGLERSKQNYLWPECAATATKLDKLLVIRSKDKSPYEKFFGETNLIQNHLKVFGEIGIVTKHNNKHITNKLNNRGVPCMFMGYAKDHAANVYQMLKLDTNTIIITRDIVWLKKTYGEYMRLTKSKKIGNYSEGADNDNNILEEDHEELSDKILNIENDNSEREKERMPCWQQNLQTFYNPHPGRKEVAENAYLSLLEGMNEPKNFQEAWNHPELHEQENWRTAINKEFNNMLKRNVRKHINKKDIPQGRKPIRSKWVFKKQRNGVYCARLVALGYSQVPGVDFTENYAPVINDITMRTMLVIMKLQGWKGEIIDVETAFLYRELKEEIYMTIPKGLN
jgi:Reverse transcriptase (RNA-dependent DNA polymerase)